MIGRILKFGHLRPLLAVLLVTALSADACGAAQPDMSPLAATLPALQTNAGGDVLIEWRFANATLGAEVWMLDTSERAREADRFRQNPTLLDVPLTDTGWPRSLPENITVTFSPTYRQKAAPPRGQLRSNEYENLTGIYVVTWNGKTLPDSNGASRFQVVDTTNDANPNIGTLILPAGPNRVIALVRHPERGVNVRYERPDPADPIRDIKIWTPLYMGAGLNLDVRAYSAARLGPGRLSEWNTEPAPGASEPLWHPLYLKHLREDPSGVMRFMDLLAINDLGEGGHKGSPDWKDRKPPTYTLGTLVGISPNNWERKPVARFAGGGQIPYEWLFDLCGQVGKDLWLQVPHIATEAHISNLAGLAARMTPKNRRLWFEFSNELWNNYGPYIPQYNAAAAEGKRSGKNPGWGSGSLQAKALKIFERSWIAAGRTDDALINVLSGFAMSVDYNTSVLDGAKAVGADIAEAFAITTYFGAGTTAELFNLPYAEERTREAAFDQARQIIRKDLYRTYEAWRANAALCRARGLPLIAYEGGSHILAIGFGDWNNPAHATFMRFLADLHKHPVMEDLYLEHWALWTAAGGLTASLFTDISAYSFFGYWGAKEDVTESIADSPRYRAARIFAKLRSGIRPLDSPLGGRPRFGSLQPLRVEAGKAQELRIPASGGDGALVGSYFAGEVPPGMTVDTLPSGGVILRGTPTTDGLFRFIVQSVDADGDPDYAVVEVTVDPRGSGAGSLLLFDPRELPKAAAARSENREEYRDRFDISRRSPATETTNEGLRLFVPFDADEPLFSTHYIDRSVSLKPRSPLAPSGGVSLTLLKEDFYRANPAIDGKPRSPELSMKNTETILWVGLRNGALSGKLGSSLDLSADAANPQGRRFGVPSRFDALFLWRRDQLEVAAGSAIAFGKGADRASLVLETQGIGADTVRWRFVIRQKETDGTSRYYLSEAVLTDTAAARFALTDFNNSTIPGKRWAIFNPTAASFAMPEEKALVFRPANFTNIDGIGLAISSIRFGWHYDFGITRLLAVGSK